MSHIVRDRDHLRKWLQTNRLLDDVHDNILKQCLTDIIEIFDGNYNIKWLLKLITKNANFKQIQSMNEIVAKRKRKFDRENMNKHPSETDIYENPDPSNTINTSISSFSLVPNECIAHICGYLTTSNIKSFKLTSRQNAIVCLQEMDKISIGVYNTNYLAQDNNTCTSIDLSVHNMCNPLLKYSRHHKTKRFYSLYNEWYNIYNIPEQNQLLFTPLFELINSENIKSDSVHENYFRDLFIFDSRKIIMLNENAVRRFDIARDTFESLIPYQLMVVQYFDMINQKYINDALQFILYHKSVTYRTLLQYFEHKIIRIANDKWYDDLQLNLQKMCVDACYEKLCILAGIGSKFSNIRIRTVLMPMRNEHIKETIATGHENVITLALNVHHPSYFEKLNARKNMKEMLESMGFDANYIIRAFVVYEKNYGFRYNAEVITEIIVRLQKKDNLIKKRKKKKLKKKKKPKKKKKVRKKIIIDSNTETDDNDHNTNNDNNNNSDSDWVP